MIGGRGLLSFSSLLPLQIPKESAVSSESHRCLRRGPHPQHTAPHVGALNAGPLFIWTKFYGLACASETCGQLVVIELKCRVWGGGKPQVNFSTFPVILTRFQPPRSNDTALLLQQGWKVALTTVKLSRKEWVLSGQNCHQANVAERCSAQAISH